MVARERGVRGRLPLLSVRVRITLVVALLASIALGLCGLIVFAVEQQRIEEQTAEQIDQELAELARLQRSPAEWVVDDRPRAADLLDTFLRRNVPQADEVLVSWYDDRAQRSSPSGSAGVAGSDALAAAVRALLPAGGSRIVDLPEYGRARVTVQAVASPGDPQAGALVVLTYLEPGQRGLRDTLRTYLVVALLSLLLVIGVAGWAAGRLLAPLRVLRQTAEEISDSDLSRRIPTSGRDDITALTRTVNTMLGRLEEAFAGQRRFLDDAGHELKTPLTVLRGHLELLDVGDPVDVEETRTLLLDEVDRMSRLVGELILLAKSDRPDFVTPAATDVAVLTDVVAAKARGLAARDWRVDARADVTAELDEQRLTQALLQLADNAVKHTDDGDEIGLGSAVDGDRLRLWVRDTGPGIPADQREAVLERFGRGTVRPGDEGFGLGLSIVRAIATAHGGRVQIDDAPGSGARVTLVVPLRLPDQPLIEELTWPAS
ncbi:HAMP domain-containing histidine kinase [Nocardioides sp. TRM66260-LWL]|uniref:sensor histidine kinase n=1 Tax=Nocardioides sp. TRM66260-LWL TaxID=2874478 RepID=UPI001CC48500|nr:HAMP domain-containing sensor histidine kinase [Nocardioides sp. TRM66260-LWL]MBZ5736458.1 HAMP domain-containing histidine kinase [Nocardioides sp. TRM66260-LWL]